MFASLPFPSPRPFATPPSLPPPQPLTPARTHSSRMGVSAGSSNANPNPNLNPNPNALQYQPAARHGRNVVRSVSFTASPMAALSAPGTPLPRPHGVQKPKSFLAQEKAGEASAALLSRPAAANSNGYRAPWAASFTSWPSLPPLLSRAPPMPSPDEAFERPRTAKYTRYVASRTGVRAYAADSHATQMHNHAHTRTGSMLMLT